MKNLLGFTLVEVLIAVFVLSVGIVAVLQAFPLGTQIQKSSQMATIASQLAQAKMEEIISQSYSSILIGTSQEAYGFNTSFLSHRRETEITYFDPDNPGLPPAQDLGIKKVEITVFWHSPLGASEKEVKIANFIAKK